MVLCILQLLCSTLTISVLVHFGVQFFPGLFSSRFIQALYGFLQGLALSQKSHAQSPLMTFWVTALRLLFVARGMKAYDEATQHFCGAEFPPLRFQACLSLGNIQRYACCLGHKHMAPILNDICIHKSLWFSIKHLNHLNIVLAFRNV